ncbi:MAG: DUF4870 domain-containing protein [Acidobacteria bacterium]|nr:DUF4870 domain-containing protein [Acidobacteriota bacterium]
MTNPEPTPVPPPRNEPATSPDARQWAMITHLSALTGLITGIGFLLGPLIVWLIKRDEYPMVDEHGKEAVNFQITVFIGFVIGGLLAIVLVGFVIMLAVGIAAVVFPIIAGIKANEGQFYRYPFTLRLIK